MERAVQGEGQGAAKVVERRNEREERCRSIISLPVKDMEYSISEIRGKDARLFITEIKICVHQGG